MGGKGGQVGGGKALVTVTVLLSVFLVVILTINLPICGWTNPYRTYNNITVRNIIVK
jgi:hypothetical protein